MEAQDVCGSKAVETTRHHKYFHYIFPAGWSRRQASHRRHERQEQLYALCPTRKCGGNCAVFNRIECQELGSYKSVISKFFTNTQPPQKIRLTNHEISLRRMFGDRIVVICEKNDAGLEWVAYLALSWARLCEMWDLIDVAVDRRDMWSTAVARYCNDLIDTLVVDENPLPGSIASIPIPVSTRLVCPPTWHQEKPVARGNDLNIYSCLNPSCLPANLALGTTRCPGAMTSIPILFLTCLVDPPDWRQGCDRIGGLNAGGTIDHTLPQTVVRRGSCWIVIQSLVTEEPMFIQHKTAIARDNKKKGWECSHIQPATQNTALRHYAVTSQIFLVADWMSIVAMQWFTILRPLLEHLMSECGVPQLNFQKRIIGGNEAYFGEFPWQAHIRIAGYQCGGVLINRLFVATAAHCIHRVVRRNVVRDADRRQGRGEGDGPGSRQCAGVGCMIRGRPGIFRMG
uniref:Peptidase S1 domain-containing protein n=1 Tax=Timema monikensis TaxID=170555 RepID=A0A7R9EHG3_9NEOP|nr:unnamed protein product [Timema monikensis]